jgi:PilZ domain
VATKVMGPAAPVHSSEAERRREKRAPLHQILVFQAYNSDGSTFEDRAELCDASTRGASFLLGQPLDPGRVLHLAAPLPRRFRSFDAETPSYFVYAIVRHAKPVDDRWRVGVMFFGKEPPKGFDAHPGALYFLPTDSAQPAPLGVLAQRAPAPAPEPDPGGRRLSQRFRIFVDFVLRQVDEWGTVLAEELTVAENVSLGGACVYTSLPLRVGHVVHVQERGGSFEARAEVRDTYVGIDRIRRVSLSFLDGRGPAHLVTSH